MERLDLHVDVRREDDSYWAEVRELPGCFASGDTVTELIESVEEAVMLYLARPTGQGPEATFKLLGLDLNVGPQAPT